MTIVNLPFPESRDPCSVTFIKETTNGKDESRLFLVESDEQKDETKTEAPPQLPSPSAQVTHGEKMPKSKTCQALTSGRAPAPGHGFPLIKRKVQADQYISTADLQVETRQVTKQLEALEERGVDLERNIRECSNEEEGLLAEWLALTQKRQFLMRRDTELVYLTKQQQLEERQADVEYELRRLLNKPESVWSQEDRSREQSLMTELLVIIEQRNQIVSILDQDRKRLIVQLFFPIREREEDALSEGMIKNTGCSSKSADSISRQPCDRKWMDN
uniref:BMERB domain-containing protein n=1 Tax=Hippocampus comes TaxID=109280 RepID=A0A3Q2XJK3_HIPCM